ncbi:DNA methyltransferase [[Clostridium] aminophilum]|uniref:DNA methyltransferase n=1 Tax=[Clostridium] aminophilum TaxID=1526 RepID=UPI002FE6D7D0
MREFQQKLSELTFLDPACGSGNFLTETYLSLRRIENSVLKILSNGQISMAMEDVNHIRVKINQFYGIEINDFAVTVAKTAFWIAESQMLKLLFTD